METLELSQKVKYAGADWLKNNLKHSRPGIEPSALALEVADLLGQLYLGIYHMDGAVIEKTDWANEHRIEITVYAGGCSWGTYDGSELTALVLLCHERNLRASIFPIAYRYFKIGFVKVTRGGFFREGHPTLEEALNSYRENG